MNEVQERNRFIDTGAVEVPVDVESKSPLWCMLQEAFVEATFVVQDELRVSLEEGREAVEGIRRSRRCWGRRGRWFDEVFEGNVGGTAIVK